MSAPSGKVQFITEKCRFVEEKRRVSVFVERDGL